MAAAAGDLTTTALVKGYGRITDPDLTTVNALLDRLVSTASEMIRSWTSRQIVRKVYTAEAYDGAEATRGSTRLYLREYPVNSVTTILENGTALSVATGYSTTADTILIPTEGILVRQGGGVAPNAYRSGRWNAGLQNVIVTYNAGYDYPRVGTPPAYLGTDLPFDIEQAATELTVLMFNEGKRIGEGGRNFAGWSVNYVRELNPHIADVIQRYERGFRP